VVFPVPDLPTKVIIGVLVGFIGLLLFMVICMFARTAAALISPLRGQLLPEGEASGGVEAKSLLPLGEGGAEGDG
jgi:hypothetical protein